MVCAFTLFRGKRVSDPAQRGSRTGNGRHGAASTGCRAGCGHEQILPAIHLIHHWRADKVAAEARGPELFSGVAVPRANLVVAACAEHDACFCDDDAVERCGQACSRDAARGEYGIIAKADAPLDGRLVEVVLHDGCIRWFDAIAHGVVFIDHRLLELLNTVRIARGAASPCTAGLDGCDRTRSNNQLRRCAGTCSGATARAASATSSLSTLTLPASASLSSGQESHEIIDICIGEMRLGRHPAFAGGKDRANRGRVKS